MKHIGVRRKKLLLLITLAQILLYSAFVVWTVQQYNAERNKLIEWWTGHGYPLEWLDYPSYLTFRLGLIAIMFGLGLIVFWICGVIVSLKPKSPSVVRT